MKDDKQAAMVESFTQELRRGSLVLLVLLESEEPDYGYSLVERLQARGIAVEQNTLYPLLRRLESQGLLTSSWDTSASRPRKYYRISNEGRALAALLYQQWRRLASTIDTVAAESAVDTEKEEYDEDC